MLRFQEIPEALKTYVTASDIFHFVNPELDCVISDYVGPGYSNALGLGNVLCQIFATNHKYKETLIGQEPSYTFGVSRRGMLIC